MSLSISRRSSSPVHVKCVLLIKMIKMMMMERISCLENTKTKGEKVYKEIWGYKVVPDCPILPGAYKYHGILNS